MDSIQISFYNTISIHKLFKIFYIKIFSPATLITFGETATPAISPFMLLIDTILLEKTFTNLITLHFYSITL